MGNSQRPAVTGFSQSPPVSSASSVSSASFVSSGPRVRSVPAEKFKTQKHVRFRDSLDGVSTTGSSGCVSPSARSAVTLGDEEAIVAGRLGGRKVKILIDSGASESYIDQGFVNARQIKSEKYWKPKRILLFDGTPSSAGPITSFVEEIIGVGNERRREHFGITKLSNGVDVVLGYSWLKKSKAVVDFERLTLRTGVSFEGRAEGTVASEGISGVKDSICLVGSENLADSHRVSFPANLEDSGGSVSVDGDQHKISTDSSRRLRQSGVISPNDIPVSVPRPWGENEVCQVELPIPETGEEAQDSDVLWSKLFAVLDKDNNISLDLDVSSADIDSLPTFGEIEFTQNEIELIESQVPEEYRDFADLFHPRLGKGTLPPHRPYDLKVELKPDAKLPLAPLYQLGPAQKEALVEVIEKERTAGRIRPSNSPYGSPTFFVTRKDKRFRMVVDYRRLNQATIPDAYPLPLIDQITSSLSQSRYFTKLDLVGAYQLLRVADGYEHLTAFRTPLGMFESLVVRDGLRNAPAVFQHFLNESLAEVVGKGVEVYIDDILIHAYQLDDLRLLTRRVFETLRKNSLYLSVGKCKFEQKSVTFLGFVVSYQGVQANPEYVEGVVKYPAPKNLRQCRRFVGMASYYRRFIPNFSRIAAPLNNLTKKDVPFNWEEDQQKAFDDLKDALMKAPVIGHFDPSVPAIIQTDASFFGWGFVISQKSHATGLEHPIAIESGSFSGAELNYTTTEKEFLAIVMAFRRRRHLLIQVSSTVLTDHLNLTFWMRPQQLNGRQARWMEFLQGFDYDLVYRPGNEAVVPDALSRYMGHEKGDTIDTNSFAQALPSFNESSSVTSSLGHLLRAVAFREDEPKLMGFESLKDGQSEDEELKPVRNFLLSIAVNGAGGHAIFNSHPPEISIFLRRLGIDTSARVEWNTMGLITINGRMYIPNCGGNRIIILKSRHDTILAGHQGVSKTLELIQRDYCWFGLRRDVENYVKGCATCQRTKTSRRQPEGLLRPLDVAERPWSSISMDFVEELPDSNGHNSILVVVDRLTKWSIFIPTTTRLSTAGLVNLLIDYVFSQHGLPTNIVSDRGSKFTSRLWAEVNDALGIQVSLSTAFHPQSDGQTERVNQVLEQYLRVFASYQQDNWDRLLSRASFAYNNSLHSAIGMSPFFANFGYSPRWIEEIQSSDLGSPLVNEKVKSLTEVHEICRENIEIANNIYANNYNKSRREGEEHQVGDMVLLSLRNVSTRRPSKKLDIRYAGPFQVVQKVGQLAYRLDLPKTMRIHNVFHVCLLKKFNRSTFPGQSYDPPGPVEIDDGGECYEVAAILDCRRSKRRLEYLVEWSGYEGFNQATWEPKSNVEGCEELVEDFHRQNPNKPR